ncbi:MAG: lysylphosphatidylglycerol synthase transmembrane domain-containing protein [Verrucomicrobia bacterium]|nr:lysylphosphatidylglycerol synthase transmembrane domain-containing protein [Verrucomicrobiota bacterium]
MKKRLLALIQLLIGLGLIGTILYRLHSSGNLVTLRDAFVNAASRWPLLAAGLATILGCLIVCALRWMLLLRAQGFAVSFGHALNLYFIGHFFNAFILGTTGGDVIKSYYIATENPQRKTEAVATVFIDRVMGLIALIVLTTVVTLCRLPFFMSYPETRLTLLFNAGMLVGSVVAFTLIFGSNLAEKWGPFRRLQEHAGIGGIIHKAYAAAHLCLRSRALVIATLLLSLANHLILILSTYFIALALQLNITFVDCLTVLPVINIIASIPLTPSGIGTRDTATVYLLGALGVAAAMALTLSLIMYVMLLIWSLLGGLVYLAYVLAGRRVQRAAVSS